MSLAEAARTWWEEASRRRSDRLRWRSSRALLGAFLLLPAATAGVRIFRGGLPSLAYDECEYALQMLETAELLFRRGLLAWPDIVAWHQQYAKPPLLVDLSAGVLLLVGQVRVVGALAVTMVVVTALTSIAVFRLVRALFCLRTALLSVTAVGAIPASGLLASRFFPEPLVTLLLVLLLGVLFSPHPRAPTTRTLLLAAVVCAGLLAKSTFPVLAAGPILLRLLDRSESATAAEMRLSIASGTVLGIAASAIWYATNFADAFAYARDAYDWASREPTSVLDHVRHWASAVALRALGIGGSVVALTVVALGVARLVGRRRATGDEAVPRDGEGPWSSLDREQRTFLLALAAASLPSIAIALPSPNVSTRLLLPAFSMLAIGAAIALAEARVGVIARSVRVVALVLLALQWSAVQVGGLSPVRASEAPPPLSRAVRALNPYFGPLDRFDIRPLEALLRATAPLAWSARALGPRQPTIYFVDNHPELDLSRFQLYQSVRRASLPVGWLCYFEWSPERRAAALKDAREHPSLVVSYRPEGSLRSDLEFLNRHADECLRAVRDPASGFRRVRDFAPPDASYALELYANFDLPSAPTLALPGS